MREITACFTGHRDIPEADRVLIADRLEAEVRALAERGYRRFITGGALGFDTMAAVTVLRVKRDSFPDMRLILALPCREQTRGWSRDDIMLYRELLAAADETVYTSEHYYGGCMQKRNRYMVDNSSACVCYMTRATGGTAYTVKYAAKNGLETVNISL